MASSVYSLSKLSRGWIKTGIFLLKIPHNVFCVSLILGWDFDSHQEGGWQLGRRNAGWQDRHFPYPLCWGKFIAYDGGCWSWNLVGVLCLQGQDNLKYSYMRRINENRITEKGLFWLLSAKALWGYTQFNLKWSAKYVPWTTSKGFPFGVISTVHRENRGGWLQLAYLAHIWG